MASKMMFKFCYHCRRQSIWQVVNLEKLATVVNCYKVVPFIDCENVRAHFLPWSTTNLMYRQRFRSLLITESSTHCATFNVLSYLLCHTRPENYVACSSQTRVYSQMSRMESFLHVLTH